MKRFTGLFAAVCLAAATSMLFAAPGPTSNVHVRGVITRMSAHAMVVKTDAGSSVTVLLPKTPKVMEIVPAPRADITRGRFVGITSITQANGAQRAVEVHVFPNSMRGAGEGSYPWDYPGAGRHKSRMTNGTVAGPATRKYRMTNGAVSAKHAGSTIVVTYHGKGGSGSQTITIPPGIPVVTFAAGKPSDLKPGATVFVMGSLAPGGVRASRVAVGEHGAKPPM